MSMTPDKDHPAPPQPTSPPWPYFPQYAPPQEEEISLADLWAAVWKGRWIVIGSALAAAAIAAAVALWLPNKYRSEALLAPAAEEQQSMLSGLAARFGGLASLAGVDVPSGGADKTTIAVETLRSRAFTSAFIRRNQLEVPLIAAKGWSEETQDWIIDRDIYDPATKQWVREVDPGKSVEPTDWELYEQFKEILSVNQDKKTGLVTVAIEYYSPQRARDWVDTLVKDINAHMRLRDIEEADRKIRYLEDQVKGTALAEMRTIFFSLIEQQTQQRMLANVQNEYVFKIIDPPVVPEEKVSPKRALVVILGIFSGGFVGLLVVFLRRGGARNEQGVEVTPPP